MAVNKKKIAKNPWLLLLTIMLMSIAGTVCNAGFAAIFLLWTLFLQIAEKCGYEKKSPVVSFTLLMIVVCNITTGNSLPCQGGVLAYMAFYVPTLIATFNYAVFIFMSFSMLAVFILIMFLFAKFILRLDVSKLTLDEKTIQEYKNMEVTNLQKVGLGATTVFIILMLVPTFLPETWYLKKVLTDLGLVGMIILMFVFFSLFKDKQGKNVIILNDCHHSVPWSVVWLLVFAIPLSDALKSDASGIMSTIMSVCTPLFDGMGLYAFMIVTMTFLGLLTQVSNNMVLGALFMPIFLNILLQLDGNPYVYFLMLLIALNCAYATPAASLQGALVHGHEAVGKKYAYCYGFLVLIAQLIACTVVLIPLGNLFW